MQSPIRATLWCHRITVARWPQQCGCCGWWHTRFPFSVRRQRSKLHTVYMFIFLMMAKKWYTKCCGGVCFWFWLFFFYLFKSGLVLLFGVVVVLGYLILLWWMRLLFWLCELIGILLWDINVANMRTIDAAQLNTLNHESSRTDRNQFGTGELETNKQTH